MLEPTPANATPAPAAPAPAAPAPAPAAPAPDVTPENPANPSGQEIPPAQNGNEVKDTQVPPDTEAGEVDPLDFLNSIFGIDPANPEKKDAPAGTEASQKDDFHNPNNEPEIFKKEIATINGQLAIANEKAAAAEKLQAIIDGDPILKAVVSAVQSGKKFNLAEGFKEYAKKMVMPTPKTESARPSGTIPAQENTLAGIVSKGRTTRPMQPEKA